MIRQITCVAAGMGSAVAFVTTQKLQAKDMVACHECRMKRLPKARELPIYDKNENLSIEYDETSVPPMMSGISSLRQQLVKYGSYLDVAKEEAVHIYETGVAHSQSSFEYLKDEENKIARIAIIGSGGLIGYLYARRGGIIKKLLMPCIGVGAMFSIFYPSIAKTYAVNGFEFTKHHVDNALSQYGGYDTGKMAEDTNAKLEQLKKFMKYEGLLEKLKNMFNNSTNASKKTSLENDENKSDQDLYTTRTPT
ncbi:uncharacterized protein LOC129231588 [Uloborus diversus]|uniref:uncharacterized protein LOC129231588 n=1 Tax=Uloborus diversus TaxID=327109 RepID=UPI00240974D3|nr:uncharacterized protein LOC129231588 [Uloborus diversus]